MKKGSVMPFLRPYSRILLWIIPAFVAFYHASLLRERNRFAEISVPFQQTSLLNGMGIDGICRTSVIAEAEAEVTTRCPETLVVGIETEHGFAENAHYTLRVTRNSVPIAFTPTDSEYAEGNSRRGRFQADANQTYRVRLMIQHAASAVPDASARLTVTRAANTRIAHALPAMGLFYLGVMYLGIGIVSGMGIYFREAGRRSRV